jgi:hypothetical protein
MQPEDKAVKDLRFWNHLWLVTLLLIGLAWLAGRVLEHVNQRISSVDTWWSRSPDALVISSLRGHVLVTHLAGFSGSSPAGVRLPEPVFLLDSEGARIDLGAFRGLDWRNEGGGKVSAPAVGSEVRALYIRLQASDWRERAAE